MITKTYACLKQNSDSYPLLITTISMETAVLLARKDGADGAEDAHSQNGDAKSNPRITI